MGGLRRIKKHILKTSMNIRIVKRLLKDNPLSKLKLTITTKTKTKKKEKI